MKNLLRFLRQKKTLTFMVIGIVGLILAGLVVFQVSTQKPTFVTVRIKGSPGNWWWVTPRPPDWLANSVHAGDKEFNASNNAIAEVLSVDIYDAGGPTKDIYLTTKLDVRYNTKTKKYRYKGEPLEIGGPISLSLGSTFFPGMVVSISGEGSNPVKYKDLTIQVRHKDRWPYEYDAIKIGEKIVDGNNQPIAEIIAKSQSPALREVQTLSGQILKGYSPVLNDYYVTIRIRAEEQGNQYIYREEQYIKIGNQLWLLFPSYNMSGAHIMAIEK